MAFASHLLTVAQRQHRPLSAMGLHTGSLHTGRGPDWLKNLGEERTRGRRLLGLVESKTGFLLVRELHNVTLFSWTRM